MRPARSARTGSAPTGGEHAYESDARRWLRAYPPRWRRAREDEVIGVLLDTRPADAERLTPRTRLDLLQGAVAYRWRTRPPPVRWLLWRWGDVLPGPPYEEWTVDDLSGRFSGVRRTWLGWVGFLALSMAAVLSDLGREPSVWAFLPLAVCVVLSLMPERWRHRHLLRELAARADDERLARGFDRSVPWSYRQRHAWTARVLLPVAGLAGGLLVSGGVLLAWWDDPTARAATASHPLQDEELLLTVLPLLPLACLALLLPLAALALGPRRARTRPPQPWRSPPRPLPLLHVVPAALVAALLPVGAAALPVAALALPADAGSTSGSPSADVLATAAGVSSVLLPLLVGVLVVSVALVACWVRVARVVREVPHPPLALADVLDLRGGDHVPVDSPVLLHRHQWAEYPAPRPR